ncbi:MAG: PD-(D/E)XK nuclease family protein [Cryomorphaceae bacterium]
MAFDFDPFRFFKIGENKISEILAAFLKPDGRHGQGELFLDDFARRLEQKIKLLELSELAIKDAPNAFTLYQKAIINLSKAQVKVEKPIDRIPDKNSGRRRIDIYIKLERYAIAVENKVWAKDQPDQMVDYKEFLKKHHPHSYVLVYLTPYGKMPSGVGMTEKEWIDGKADGSLCSMSYKNDILPMLESWEAKCKAERVRFFIREFRNHLHVKFFGGNHLTMTKSLEPIIRDNAIATKELVKAYLKLESNLIDKIDHVSNGLSAQHKEKIEAFPSPYGNPTHYVVKKGIAVTSSVRNEQDRKIYDTAYVHLSEHNLDLHLTFYLDNKDNLPVLEEIRGAWESAEKNNMELERIPRIEKNEMILVLRPSISKSELLKLFKDKMELVSKALEQQSPELPVN